MHPPPTSPLRLEYNPLFLACPSVSDMENILAKDLNPMILGSSLSMQQAAAPLILHKNPNPIRPSPNLTYATRQAASCPSSPSHISAQSNTEPARHTQSSEPANADGPVSSNGLLPSSLFYPERAGPFNKDGLDSDLIESQPTIITPSLSFQPNPDFYSPSTELNHFIVAQPGTNDRQLHEAVAVIAGGAGVAVSTHMGEGSQCDLVGESPAPARTATPHVQPFGAAPSSLLPNGATVQTLDGRLCASKNSMVVYPVSCQNFLRLMKDWGGMNMK